MKATRLLAIVLLLAAAGGRVSGADSATGAAERIEITGATAFPPDTLRGSLSDATESIEREGVTPATADDAAFFLELFYRRNGFANALVNYTILPGGRLQLKVDEGLPVMLGKIDFVGGGGVPEDKQRAYFLGPTRTRIPEGKTELPFIQSDINAGRYALLEYYQSEGYLEARVDPPVATLHQGGRVADVQIRISEGRRYRFGPVQMVGIPSFADEPEPRSWFRRTFLFQRPRSDSWGRVQSDLEELSKEPFTTTAAEAMARKVEGFLKLRGYFTARVTAWAEPRASRNGVVPVRLLAQPGLCYRVGEITVEGTDRLKPAYVQNRFGVLRGQIYDPTEFDRVFQDEMRTGLFTTLRVNPQPQPDGTLNLGLTVVEAKARELGFSLGYGTYDGPIVGFEARDRNLFGTGRPLTFRAIYSTRALTGEFLYQDPHWLETKNSLLLKLAAGTFQNDSYHKNEVGFTAQLSRKLIREIEIAGFLTARADNLTELFVTPANAGPQRYALGSAGLTGTFDFRDSPLMPLRGLAFNVTVDYTQGSGSGDRFEFVRATTRLSYYIPIRRTTLAFGFRAGVIESLNRNVIPIDERFFNGGSTTVRSFADRRLGPRDNVSGNPIGGSAFTIMNVEYSFPIRGDFRGAIFYDLGNITPSLGFSELRSGVGAGIRYNLPIGPLRIDYGVNPSPKPGDSRGALHVSFGIAF